MILTFIGTTELLLIAALALLLVGGKKFPEMMRGLGKGMREFKDGMKESPSDFNEDKTADGNKESRKSSISSSERKD